MRLELEILQKGDFNQVELNEMEITYIRLFKSNNRLYGYNMTKGGDGANGYKYSKESKLKMSKVHKGKIITEQHIEKIKDTKRKNGTLNKTGYKHSQESIDKIKQTKIKNGTLNFITSEETKKKISEKLKGRVSPRKGKPASNKGIKSKPESIQKMLKTKEFNRNMKLIKENNFVYDWLF